MALDLVKTIGIERDVEEFVRKYSLNALATGGAIEILRSPLNTGWLPTSIQIEIANGNEYPLDPEAVELLTPYKEKLAGQGKETKYRVVGLDKIPTEPNAIRVVLVPATYEESTGFHWSLRETAKRKEAEVSTLKERWAAQMIHPGSYNLPGTAVVHVIVTSSDDQVILCRRSPNAYYHPSHWSISFEEQVNEKDRPFGNAAFSAAALRGFSEELVPQHTMKLDNVRMLGVFLEYSLLNMEFCMHIETPFAFDEIRFNWNTKAKDKWEATAVVSEPFTLENTVRLLKSNSYGELPDGIHRFHPTSKYRLLLASASQFGWDAVTNAFK